MIKRIFSYLIFTGLVVLVFNLLDYVFDRFISHGTFTFDSLSNIILPIGIAVLVIVFFAVYRKVIK